MGEWHHRMFHNGVHNFGQHPYWRSVISLMFTCQMFWKKWWDLIYPLVNKLDVNYDVISPHFSGKGCTYMYAPCTVQYVWRGVTSFTCSLLTQGYIRRHPKICTCSLLTRGYIRWSQLSLITWQSSIIVVSSCEIKNKTKIKVHSPKETVLIQHSWNWIWSPQKTTCMPANSFCQHSRFHDVFTETVSKTVYI